MQRATQSAAKAVSWQKYRPWSLARVNVGGVAQFSPGANT